MPLTYKEIKRILDDYNFYFSRSRGSHFRYEKNGYGVTIPFHKEYPQKTSKSILKSIAHITGENYSNLIKKYNIKI